MGIDHWILDTEFVFLGRVHMEGRLRENIQYTERLILLHE